MRCMKRARMWLSGMAVLVVLAGVFGLGQEDRSRRGRKYKAPPPTSHVEVVVTKNSNGKPIANAAVIFRATRNGKDDGNLEVKTDPDGKASLDVIETGSTVLVQVFANGYATFAEQYDLKEPSREIHVALLRPREQVSAYEDNSGKASTRKAGIQEPEGPPHKGEGAATGLLPRTGTAPGSASGSGAAGAGTGTSSADSGTQAGEQGKKGAEGAPADRGSESKQAPDKTQSAPQL